MDAITESIINTKERKKKAVLRLDEDIALLLALAESREFHAMAASALGVMRDIIATSGDVLTPKQQGLSRISAQIAAMGRACYQVLSNLSTLMVERGERSRVAAIYADALCTIKTALERPVKTILDTKNLLGASNCSSTGGGAPSLRDQRFIDRIAVAEAPGYSTNSSAAAHLSVWDGDPLVLSGISESQVYAALLAVGQGVVVDG